MGLKNKFLDYCVLAIPEAIKRRIITNAERSHVKIYSQEGEDRLLERFIGAKTYGVYIDVGAHHPINISNTYYFYLKGWRGINIDAMPGSMKLFNQFRQYDINIELPISNVKERLTFYIFNTPELNTFNKENVKHYLEYPNVKLLNTLELETTKLVDVLDKNLPMLGAREIDFLTIDVEGFDLKVLKSNDWNKYRPNFVLVEDLFSNVIDSYNGQLCIYMQSVGYTMKAKTHNTVFFQKC